MEEVNEVTNVENIADEPTTSDEDMKMEELLGPEVSLEEGKSIKVRVIGKRRTAF